MSFLKNIMDKLSGGSYSRLPETDLEKVIAERDALRKELELVMAQYKDVCQAAQEVLAAKAEFIEALDRLAQENMMLRTALNVQAGKEVKN